MSEHQIPHPPPAARAAGGRFADPRVTADGAARAYVAPGRMETLWFNTGSVCNIECVNCYMESGPRNWRLAYISAGEVGGFLDEIAALELDVGEIGFTGGEPFMNPDIVAMVGDALGRGHEALVLTNAMQPMMRPRVQEGLRGLGRGFGARLALRVSLDHHTPALHDSERGAGSWDKTLAGMEWIVANGLRIRVAGRSRWDEDEARARQGYRELFAARGIPVDADDHSALVIFPEMDPAREVPEITTACWELLGVDPATIMCASSRMVIKRRGRRGPGWSVARCCRTTGSSSSEAHCARRWFRCI